MVRRVFRESECEFWSFNVSWLRLRLHDRHCWFEVSRRRISIRKTGTCDPECGSMLSAEYVDTIWVTWSHSLQPSSVSARCVQSYALLAAFTRWIARPPFVYALSLLCSSPRLSIRFVIAGKTKLLREIENFVCHACPGVHR